MELVSNTHVTKVGSTYYILIPKNLLHVIEWKHGTTLTVHKSGKKLIFESVVK